MQRFWGIALCSLGCLTLAACSGSEDEPATAQVDVEFDPNAKAEMAGKGEDDMTKPDEIADVGDADEPTEDESADDSLFGATDEPDDTEAEGADELFAEIDEETSGSGNRAETSEPDDLLAETTSKSEDDLAVDDLLGDEGASEESTEVADSAEAESDELSDLFAGEIADEPATDDESDAGLDDLLAETDEANDPGNALEDPRSAPDPADDGLAGLLDDEPQEINPQEVVSGFLATLTAGDLATAEQAIFTPSEVEWQEMVQKQVAKLHDELKTGIRQIEYLEDRQEGDWLLVVARVVTQRDGASEQKVSDQYFYRDGNQWKMMPETVRTHAGGAEKVNANFDALAQWYQDNKADLEQRHLQ